MTRLTRIAVLALLLPGLALASSIGGVGGGTKSGDQTRAKVQQDKIQVQQSTTKVDATKATTAPVKATDKAPAASGVQKKQN